MEIKCKVSFALPEELMNALDINDDTDVIAFIENGRVIVEVIDSEEDDLYEEDGYDCDEDECEYCEYYCQHCGKCVLN